MSKLTIALLLLSSVALNQNSALAEIKIPRTVLLKKRQITLLPPKVTNPVPIAKLLDMRLLPDER